MQPSDDEHRSEPTPPPRRHETLVPALAVAAVAVAAVAAAVMARRAEFDAPHGSRAPGGEIVQAPQPQAPATRAMGGASACGNCGVVENVQALMEPGRQEPRAYRLRIRMDDGNVRTIEQRVALGAGSRVIVEGSAARPMS